MMIASNGLGAMFGNFLAGYAIDWGGADAMLGMCLVFGVIGVLFMLGGRAEQDIKRAARRLPCRFLYGEKLWKALDFPFSIG